MSAISAIENVGLVGVMRSTGAGNKYRLIGVSDRHQTSTENTTSTKNGTSTETGTTPVPKTGLHQYQKRDTNLSVTNKEPINRKSKPLKTPLPSDFGISESVRKWAESKGYRNLEAPLEWFRDWATAGVKEYADWDATFRNAVRGNWAKVSDARQVENSNWSSAIC